MSSDEIFDWIVTKEDEYLRVVETNVINDATREFGDAGKKIAQQYYDIAYHGKSESTENDIEEPCEDCKKVAEKLSENMSVLQDVGKIMYMQSLENDCKDVDYSYIIDFLNTVVCDITKESLLNHDPNDLKLFILLNVYKLIKNNKKENV
jgi:hypothetical protein